MSCVAVFACLFCLLLCAMLSRFGRNGITIIFRIVLLRSFHRLKKEKVCAIEKKKRERKYATIFGCNGAVSIVSVRVGHPALPTLPLNLQRCVLMTSHVRGAYRLAGISMLLTLCAVLPSVFWEVAGVWMHGGPRRSCRLREKSGAWVPGWLGNLSTFYTS